MPRCNRLKSNGGRLRLLTAEGNKTTIHKVPNPHSVFLFSLFFSPFLFPPRKIRFALMVQINSGVNQTNKINPNLKIHCLSGLATHYLHYVFELCSAFRGLQVIQGNFAFTLSFWLIFDLKILCVWYGLHASLQEILSRRNTCKDAERSSQSFGVLATPADPFTVTRADL